jgi:splicing factor 45
VLPEKIERQKWWETDHQISLLSAVQPSEVILLENMVDVADIDDDLTGEIGEECSKHGYVQRVFIWPNGPKGVRIFVKFSGMAGAWRCVKELEGRFFGGKTVRARYYPLQDFERANYMIMYN